LPELVGQTAEIESVDPAGSCIVRLTVTLERVERVEPLGAQMSVLLPDAQEMQRDIVTSSVISFISFHRVKPGELDCQTCGDIPGIDLRGGMS